MGGFPVKLIPVFAVGVITVSFFISGRVFLSLARAVCRMESENHSTGKNSIGIFAVFQKLKTVLLITTLNFSLTIF